MYVTFNVRNLPCFGGKIERYAIKCENIEQARCIASDVNAFDGVSYLRISSRKNHTRKLWYLTGIDILSRDISSSGK